MLFLLYLGGVSAQTLQVMTDARGKLGYKDADGNIVIKCVYDYAEPFDANGVAKVGKAGKYGLLSTDGSFVLPMVYAEIQTRIEGVPTVVKKGKKYGLINPATGAIMLPVEYSFVSAYNCYGLAWFTKGGKIVDHKGRQSISNGKMGIVDKAGNILLQPEYDGVFEFSRHLESDAPKMYGKADLLTTFDYFLTDTLATDCQYLGFCSTPFMVEYSGVMDIKGKVLLPNYRHNVVSKPVEGMIRYWDIDETKVEYGYYDIAKAKEGGVFSIKMQQKEKNTPKTAVSDEENSTVAVANALVGILGSFSSFGKKNTHSSTQSPTSSSGSYTAGTSISLGEMRKQAEKSIDKITHYDFHGNMAIVRDSVRWYLFDKSFVIKGLGEERAWFAKGAGTDDGYWTVIGGKNSALYKTDGTKLLQNISFSDVSLPDFNYGNSTNIAVKANGKWGLYTENGVALINPKFEYLTSSRNGMYLCKANGLWGAVNEKGLVLIPVKYRGIIPPKSSPFDNVWVMGSDSLYYNYALKAKKTLPQSYQKVEAFRDGMAMVQPAGEDACADGKRIIVGTGNEILFGTPFPIVYENDVRGALAKNGGKALSNHEAHKLVLGMTQKTAHYRMYSIIDEDAWDY